MVNTHLKSNYASSPVLKWLPYNDEKPIHASAVVLSLFFDRLKMTLPVPADSYGSGVVGVWWELFRN